MITAPSFTQQESNLDSHNNVFYKLQSDELIALYQAKLIKSAAYIHFALKIENPFCDRPVTVIPKQFAVKWGVPEKTVYRAIARLKELKILNIKSGKLIIEWVKNSQLCEKILRSEKKFSTVRKNSQLCENQNPEPAPSISPEIPQTIQTIQILQTPEVENNNLSILDKNCASENNESPHVARYNADIPSDLENRLREANINIDKKLLAAIATHDISQAYGAIAHIENTSESINCTRAVFLYQLPKQPIEKLGSRYNEEILNNMKAQNLAIEKERKDPEYRKKVKETFTQIRAKLEKKKAQ